MNLQTIKSYESMAKFCLSEEDRLWAVSVMSNVEQCFQELDSINTQDIAPLITVLDLQNVMREDIAKKLITREELLSNAPEDYDGYFQVPKTLE